MNSNAQLFQYAVIWNPNEKQAEAGEKAKILVEPKFELATSQDAVTKKAIRAIPADYDDQLDQVQIAVRPF
ncbi:MAG: hypothetical protein KDH96_02160 [Candidatus Riesia sp.]|nr:hypothetical protein [Candidatus Riesia sp.]